MVFCGAEVDIFLSLSFFFFLKSNNCIETCVKQSSSFAYVTEILHVWGTNLKQERIIIIVPCVGHVVEEVSSSSR